ncbi:lipase 1-like [Plodia interpunctella]|uniref:lipase 1-like n=1 Tax=Plodia interpunctella TaxID=58824 RepID=UPI002367B19D|nr:lipase 1-like [Plodia interpunctella]
MMEKIAILILVALECYVQQTVPHPPDLVLPGDAYLDFPGLAKKYDLDCAIYDVTTEDGYILKLFHIPGNKSSPVLVIHGVLDSADSFILRGNSSLTAILHKNGYDVWVGNARGSRYGRRHETLNPDADKSFWSFSFHEIGYYDLPAMIDFVLDKTKMVSLSAIGHSQGNQVFYVLGAARPDYNKKIRVLIALAPICYLHNVMPPVNDVVALGPIINELLLLVGREEILGDTGTVRKIIDLFCLEGPQGYKMCVEGIFFPLAGPDPAEFEPEFARIVLNHYPTGTSRKNAKHLLQVAQKREFLYYDYGTIENLAKYNSIVPPKYDLGKVTMKVALISGKNDRLSTLKDVKILRKQLPNLVDYKVLDYPYFNHMDFIWAKHMRLHLFPHVIKILRTYGQG